MPTSKPSILILQAFYDTFLRLSRFISHSVYLAFVEEVQFPKFQSSFHNGVGAIALLNYFYIMSTSAGDIRRSGMTYLIFKPK